MSERTEFRLEMVGDQEAGVCADGFCEIPSAEDGPVSQSSAIWENLSDDNSRRDGTGT
ncbi:MAG: hypothetical protein KF742_09995 [Cryobacterium sp.]|nr:hypothetical protein [Cryobacterium sp.]MCO5294202.1 hypothetical protein [Homoserinimonas sp.]MCW5944730.1 hypothetical protein [Cryobacterium sp.]